MEKRLTFKNEEDARNWLFSKVTTGAYSDYCIDPGDDVVIHRQDAVEAGEIGAFATGNGGILLKRVTAHTSKPDLIGRAVSVQKDIV